MPAIVGTDAVAETTIGARAAERFDPGMLVGRNRLLGKLAADPVGFLGHHDRLAGAGGRQGRGAPADAAAKDDDIGSFLAGGSFLSGDQKRRQGRGGEEMASVHAPSVAQPPRITRRTLAGAAGWQGLLAVPRRTAYDKQR